MLSVAAPNDGGNTRAAQALPRFPVGLSPTLGIAQLAGRDVTRLDVR